MKTRIIQTRFWEDDTVESISKDGKLLWIFLLTNKELGMSNYVKIADVFIEHFTGLTRGELQKAKEQLENTNKVLFYKDWIFIRNLEKENKYMNSPKNISTYNLEIEHIPIEIKEYFSNKLENATTDTDINTSIDTSIASSSDTNHKSEIINKKTETIDYRKELEILMSAWNQLFKTRKTAIEPILKNYKYWRNIYTAQDIKEAIINYHKNKDKYWNKDADLLFLFRTKNSNGECDYIADWLNLK